MLSVEREESCCMSPGESIRVNARGSLELGGCDALELAAEYGTPLYVMDETLIRARCRDYLAAFGARRVEADVAYAGKAFLTLAMCRIVAEEGMALDVVSAGELEAALAAGFAPERVYFHGNNKTAVELATALESGVGRVVVDSLSELARLSSLAQELGRRVAISVRVAPGVDAHTHEYIQTGRSDSKFGIPLLDGSALSAAGAALRSRWLELKGFHCHIGSQILNLAPFQVAAERMVEFAAEVKAETGFEMEELNLGGGLGVPYLPGDAAPSIDEYVEALVGVVRAKARECGLRMPRLVVEPGRSIVAQAGTTLYRVGTIKRIPGVRTYACVDGGMADNPRPMLYGARYHVIVANRAAAQPTESVWVAGRFCETGDILVKEAAVPEIEEGDVLAVLCTGAYNHSMASTYNMWPRPAVVMVGGGAAQLIVRRETCGELVRRDVLPARLASASVVRHSTTT